MESGARAARWPCNARIFLKPAKGQGPRESAYPGQDGPVRKRKREPTCWLTNFHPTKPRP